MLEMLERNSFLILTLLTVFLLGCIIYTAWVLFSTKRDLELLSSLTRQLVRNGTVASRVDFSNQSIEIIWRKILSFYGGVSRFAKLKTDSEKVISNAIELLGTSDNSSEILEVLSEVVLRSSSPESRFVSIAEFDSNQKSWQVKSAAGISKNRLADPFLLVLDELPFTSSRTVIYATRKNGSQFDFRGLGVGLSLFVSIIRDDKLFGVLWVGFSESAGSIEEGRRETLELIVQHAVVSYLAAQKSESRTRVSEENKDRILALSHDLKSPSVRALYALRELRSKSKFADRESEYFINEVEYALDEQLGLIGALFSADKCENNEPIGVRASEIEIANAVKTRVEAFKLIARSVNLDIRFGPLHRAKVEIARETLNRILDNLISNAIKYTHDGHISISTILTKGKVELRIEDTGGGVPKELLPYLFSTEMRDQKKMSNSGQGFGLSVVRKLVEDCGGKISYIEREDRGSIFSVFLNVKSSIDTGYFERDDFSSVLIIDDEMAVRAVHAKWAKEIFGKVFETNSFNEAEAILEVEKPDLIVADLNIPHESFYEFMMHVDSKTPVVVLTGQNLYSAKKNLADVAGIQLILEKPIERKEFRNVLAKYLAESRKALSYEKAA